MVTTWRMDGNNIIYCKNNYRQHPTHKKTKKSRKRPRFPLPRERERERHPSKSCGTTRTPEHLGIDLGCSMSDLQWLPSAYNSNDNNNNKNNNNKNNNHRPSSIKHDLLSFVSPSDISRTILRLSGTARILYSMAQYYGYERMLLLQGEEEDIDWQWQWQRHTRTLTNIEFYLGVGLGGLFLFHSIDWLQITATTTTTTTTYTSSSRIVLWYGLAILGLWQAWDHQSILQLLWALCCWCLAGWEALEWQTTQQQLLLLLLLRETHKTNNKTNNNNNSNISSPRSWRQAMNMYILQDVANKTMGITLLNIVVCLVLPRNNVIRTLLDDAKWDEETDAEQANQLLWLLRTHAMAQIASLFLLSDWKDQQEQQARNVPSVPSNQQQQQQQNSSTAMSMISLPMTQLGCLWLGLDLPLCLLASILSSSSSSSWPHRDDPWLIIATIALLTCMTFSIGVWTIMIIISLQQQRRLQPVES